VRFGYLLYAIMPFYSCQLLISGVSVIPCKNPKLQGEKSQVDRAEDEGREKI